MVGICDIHSHILFGVDDGSRNLEQSLRMLDIAYSEGIRTIILTPHYNQRYCENSCEELKEKYEILCHEMSERHPDMSLHLGNEIYYTEQTAEKLESGDAFTMAGGSYVLVEFAGYVDLSKLNHAVTILVQYGYRPILAHVERYECLLKQPDYVATLSEMGAYIQINAGSVRGNNGRTARKMVRRLLREQRVHFIATDAHGDINRAPNISKCAKYVEKKYGHEYAEQIFVRNPQCVINNKYV